MVHTYQGRGEEALAHLLDAAESAPEAASLAEAAWAFVASFSLRSGDPVAALEAIDKARLATRDVEMEADLAALAAIAQARAGRAIAARTAARQHERLSAQLPGPDPERTRLAVEAELALAEGDLATARERLEAAVELLPLGPTLPPYDVFVDYAYPLATTLLAAGEPSRAAELFERITQSGGQRLYYPFEYVRSFYFLGKIAEDDGDFRAARRYYQRFLDYWGDGNIDPDKVQEARVFVDAG